MVEHKEQNLICLLLLIILPLSGMEGLPTSNTLLLLFLLHSHFLAVLVVLETVVVEEGRVVCVLKFHPATLPVIVTVTPVNVFNF